MPARFDLRLMSVFVAVAEAESFVTAAKKLARSPATVSRDIARLERLTGARLIDRTTRSFALTEVGRELLTLASSHIDSLRGALFALVNQGSSTHGTLRVTASPDLGVTLLPEVVARLLAVHPNMSVELELTSGVVDIVRLGFDVALRFTTGEALSPDLGIRRLVRDIGLHFYASPGYVAAHGVPTHSGSSDHRWLGASSTRPSRITTPSVAKSVRTNDFLMLRELAVRSVGVALLPEFVGEPAVNKGDLVRLPLETPSMPVASVVLLYPSVTAIPQRVKIFAQILTDYLAERPMTASATTRIPT